MSKLDIKFERLTPFKRCVLQNFPFIEEDFDALTNYGLLSKVVEYLNKVIDSQNKVQGVTKEIVTAFNNLYDYVKNFFDNLDVQEEINNKLDEMAQDGTLDNIILNYLQMNPMITFDTLGDAQASEQLINGSTFRTLGKETLNDGYGAIYKVGTTSTDIALQNDLYASVVEDFGGNNYIDEITLSTDRTNESDVYILTVPMNDNDGELIAPYVAYNGSGESPLTYADKNYTTVSINASCTVKTATLTDYTMPILIGNGVVLNDTDALINAGDVADNYTYIGVTADRTIKEFKMNNTTAQQMLDAGCVNVFNAYFKLLEHGSTVDLSHVETPAGGSLAVDRHPRQIFATKADGTILIITNDGRDGHNLGTTGAEIQAYLQSINVYDAWELDGGGSTSTIFKGSKLNRNIDDHHTAERHIPYSLNFKKPTIDEELAKAYSYIGQQKQMLNKQILDTVVQNRAKDFNNADLDEHTNTLEFGMGNSITNAPIATSAYVAVIPHSNPQLVGKYCTQFFSSRDTGHLYKRSLVNEVWGAWRPVTNLCEEVWKGTSQTLADGNATKLQFKDELGDDYSKFITLDNETSVGSGIYQGVKVNTLGYYRFTLTVEVTPASDHTIALAGKRDTGTTGQAQQTVAGISGKRQVIVMDYITQCNALTNVFSYEITGASGDIIHRVKLIVEQLNH